jgi:diguanylate cyclase (GGDEF)-like protein
MSRRLQGPSGPGAVAIASGMIFFVAAGDRLTGSEALFTVLYLAPVAFGTWFASVRAGILLSALSAVISLELDLAGRAHPLRPTVVAWNFLVLFGVFLALALVLDALRDRLAQEQEMARTDALTGIPNRRSFLESATLEVARARRHGRPLTIAFLDCDNFKLVNDLHGHATGDALLAKVGRTLRGSTRAVDTVARLGGDEFGLLLPETDGPTARALVDRLRTTLLGAMRESRWAVSFSVGAVTFEEAPGAVDEMLNLADALMYESKRAGKDAVRHEVVAPPARRATG